MPIKTEGSQEHTLPASWWNKTAKAQPDVSNLKTDDPRWVLAQQVRTVIEGGGGPCRPSVVSALHRIWQLEKKTMEKETAAEEAFYKEAGVENEETAEGTLLFPLDVDVTAGRLGALARSDNIIPVSEWDEQQELKVYARGEATVFLNYPQQPRAATKSTAMVDVVSVDEEGGPPAQKEQKEVAGSPLDWALAQTTEEQKTNGQLGNYEDDIKIGEEDKQEEWSPDLTPRRNVSAGSCRYHTLRSTTSSRLTSTGRTTCTACPARPTHATLAD